MTEIEMPMIDQNDLFGYLEDMEREMLTEAERASHPLLRANARDASLHYWYAQQILMDYIKEQNELNE